MGVVIEITETSGNFKFHCKKYVYVSSLKITKFSTIRIKSIFQFQVLKIQEGKNMDWAQNLSKCKYFFKEFAISILNLFSRTDY